MTMISMHFGHKISKLKASIHTYAYWHLHTWWGFSPIWIENITNLTDIAKLKILFHSFLLPSKSLINSIIQPQLHKKPLIFNQSKVLLDPHHFNSAFQISAGNCNTTSDRMYCQNSRETGKTKTQLLLKTSISISGRKQQALNNYMNYPISLAFCLSLWSNF